MALGMMGHQAVATRSSGCSSAPAASFPAVPGSLTARCGPTARHPLPRAPPWPRQSPAPCWRAAAHSRRAAGQPTAAPAAAHVPRPPARGLPRPSPQSRSTQRGRAHQASGQQGARGGCPRPGGAQRCARPPPEVHAIPTAAEQFSPQPHVFSWLYLDGGLGSSR